MKLARIGIQAVGALIVAAAAAYMLTMPRVGPAAAARQARATGEPAHMTRAVAWAHPPGPHSTGWQRERWIMANQPAWIQREWRAASCPPLRTESANGTLYYFRWGGAPGVYGPGTQTVYDPPVGLMSDWPWYGDPIPATGFPYAGARGCQ